MNTLRNTYARRVAQQSRPVNSRYRDRSPFLDELADTLRRTGETISKPPLWPLLPCLRAFEQAKFDPVAPELLSEWKNTIDPRIALTNELEAAKQEEIRPEDFFSVRTPITKKFQREVLLALGVGFGFRVQKRSLVKELNHHIELRLSRDVGGSPRAVGLGVEAQLVAAEDSTVVFPILWHKLSPGFQYYRVYNSSAACVLGIRAHLTIATAFGDSL